jgi:hypothetical protein
MLKRLVAAVAFVVLVIAVIGYVIWSSLDFQQCVKSHANNDPASEHLEEGIPAFVRAIPTHRHCIGAYVTNKNPVITALGTLVIAIFTTVLGIFTVSLSGSRIAAQAAKESADALAQSERAQFFVIVRNEKIEALVRPIRLSIQANEKVANDEIVGREQTTTVQCVFKNYGKTPAIVKEINLRLAYFENLPAEPVYIARDTVLSEFMVASGNETDPQNCELERRLTREQTNRVVRAQSYIWFYGRVVYDDVFGRKHQHRFLWRYGGERGFRPNYEHP